MNRDDEQQFRDLYRDNYQALLAYARRRLSQLSDAENVTAEIFTTAWRRFAQLPEMEAERRLWLYGIARNVLANHRRSVSRSLHLNERALGLAPEHSGASDEWVDDASDLSTVVGALNLLGATDRELLMLSLWEELKNPQIAVVMGISVANVAVRIHRAKWRLRGHCEHLMKEPPPTGHVLQRNQFCDTTEQEVTG